MESVIDKHLKCPQTLSRRVPDNYQPPLDEILPTLQDGMDFLRDNGQPLGCYSNRFVRNIDAYGNFLDMSYNIGHWRSLEKLERGTEAHPPHCASSPPSSGDGEA